MSATELCNIIWNSRKSDYMFKFSTLGELNGLFFTGLQLAANIGIYKSICTTPIASVYFSCTFLLPEQKQELITFSNLYIRTIWFYVLWDFSIWILFFSQQIFTIIFNFFDGPINHTRINYKWLFDFVLIMRISPIFLVVSKNISFVKS